MDRIILINDREKIEKVYSDSEAFLKKNPPLSKEIGAFLWAYHEIEDLIPILVHNFWSGHNFPLNESYSELENSYQLCLSGFYRYAFVALRNVLELGLLSVYWDKSNQSHIDIQQWLRANEDTPRRQQIIEGLKQIPNINSFAQSYNLWAEIKSLYDALSDFVHTKGLLHSSRGLSGHQSNVNQFSEASFRRWISTMKSVVQIMCIVHLLRYPVGLQYTPMDEKFGLNSPAGGFLNPFQQDQIKKILDPKAVKILKEISDKDETAVNLTQEINSRPDITNEEMERQILEWDKFHIRNQGWKSWYTNESKIYNSAANRPEERARFKKRAVILKSWATQNGFLKSKSPRRAP